jgi:hypothetical protein
MLEEYSIVSDTNCIIGQDTSVPNKIVITGIDGLRTVLGFIEGTWRQGKTLRFIFDKASGEVIFQPTEEPHKPLEISIEIKEKEDDK